MLQRELQRLVFHTTAGFESLSKLEQVQIATYQAGKALMHVLCAKERLGEHAEQILRSGQHFAWVTASAIEQQIQELPAFTSEPVVSNRNLTQRRTYGQFITFNGSELFKAADTSSGRIDTIMELLAGSCAQDEVLHEQVMSMQTADFATAAHLCFGLVSEGLPKEIMSKEEIESYKKAAAQRFATMKAQVRALLHQHAKALNAMVHFMIDNPENPHLSSIDILDLLQHIASQDATAAQPVAAQPVAA